MDRAAQIQGKSLASASTLRILTGTVDLGPCLTGSSDPGAQAGVAATKSSAKPRILALI